MTTILPGRPGKPIVVDVEGSPSVTVRQGIPGPAGPAGVGVPTGGSTGQVLTKVSATDYDTNWQTPGGGGAGTNLAWDAATSTVTSDTGTDATLTLVNTSQAGLAPASGGGTTNFLRADGTWAAPPGGGGVTDGDKGDITVSGSGATWTIDAGAVSLSKMANLAASTIIGNSTGSPATPIALTAAQVKTLLAIAASDVSGLATVATSGSASDLGAGTLPTARLPAFGSGDVSFAASGGAGTIAADAVTFAKMQNIATDTLIGRDTAATGDPEAISVTGGIEFSGSASIRTSAFTGEVTKTAGGTALTIADNAVVNARLADMAANTIKANATAGATDPADLAVGTNTVVGRVAGNIVAAQLATGQVADDAITNAKLANVATATFKGRTTAGTGDPEDLTATQATALLDTVTSGAKGLAPASGGGTTNFLRADGTWAAPGGGGATNLAWVASTSTVTSDTGTDATLTLVDTSNPGLAPTRSGVSTEYLSGTGVWSTPAGGGGGFDFGINAAMAGLVIY